MHFFGFQLQMGIYQHWHPLAVKLYHLEKQLKLYNSKSSRPHTVISMQAVFCYGGGYEGYGYKK